MQPPGDFHDVVVGLAGHIDHGKTTLVAALTGHAGDRRPEERARKITIDLGFSHAELGPYRLGVIDVPGHERFVGNMLAGAAGVEVALLVVAADDSAMPQTREHLAILDLLGVRSGVVALTKCDLVDATTREVAVLEVRELLAGTGLSDAAIVPVSARTGAGLPELRAALQGACAGLPPGRCGPFRLMIDRAFAVAGHGSVVTGSVLRGAVESGGELDWHPGGGLVEPVRVRGLARHGHAVERAGAGSRVALNLAGVPLERLKRGQELGTPGSLFPSRRLAVRLAIARDAPAPLGHRLTLRLHHGTADAEAVVSLLDARQLRPGESGLAQLFVRAPLCAEPGDRFVLRSPGGEFTWGGGVVLDPTLPRVRRRHLDALEQLERLAGADNSAKLEASAHLAGLAGRTSGELARLAGHPDPAEFAARLAGLAARGVVVGAGNPPRYWHAARLSRAGALLEAELAARHAAFPLMSGHDADSVCDALPAALGRAAFDAALAHAVAGGRVARDGRRLALASFRPKLSQAQRKLLAKLVGEHRLAGLAPPAVSDYLPQVQSNKATLADLFAVAVADGHLERVGPELYLHAEHAGTMRDAVRTLLAELGESGATVGDIRDRLGTTRKYAVPICEYLDSVGVTRREGDKRFPATPPATPPAGTPGGG